MATVSSAAHGDLTVERESFRKELNKAETCRMSFGNLVSLAMHHDFALPAYRAAAGDDERLRAVVTRIEAAIASGDFNGCPAMSVAYVLPGMRPVSVGWTFTPQRKET